MKKNVCFFLMISCYYGYSQSYKTGNVYHNSFLSEVKMVFTDLHVLPDTIIPLTFSSLTIQGCYNLDLDLLFKQLEGKKELTSISLIDCNLNYIPKSIENIPSLKHLVLNSNNIKEIAPEIENLNLTLLSLSDNKIGFLTHKQQENLYASIEKFSSPLGISLNLRNNFLDTLPDVFSEILLNGLSLSDNCFDKFPIVLVKMINESGLRNLSIDYMPSLFLLSCPLNHVVNKYNRSYVNIEIDCFIEAPCATSKQIDELNGLYINVFFQTTWARSRKNCN